MQTNALSRIPRGIVSVRADSGAPDVKALIEGVNKAFADFKAENDKRLDAIKAGAASSDLTAKVETINADVSKLQAAVDEANIKLAAAQMNGAGSGNHIKDKEYTEAFNAHFKRGDVQAALNKGASDQGGYLAPVEWDRSITDKLVLVSPMRQIASVQSISTAGFSKLFNKRGTTSGWVGEADARTGTATPTFGSLTYATGELYANPAATQQMLDDSAVDLESWLAGEVETEFAYQEGLAFVSGNGTNKPNGILTYITGGANAAVHPYGAITLTNSGDAALVKADGIISLIHALPSAFTGNARFIMNRTTLAAVRLLKDGQGNYLWQPSYIAGQPSTLCGFPVTEVPDMPNVAAGACPILFGDFARGYLVVDRTGVRVLRDPFTNKPYVSFYTTKRVGGGLLNPEVIKGLKISV